jgi:predicted RND superfamily exporter protein
MLLNRMIHLLALLLIALTCCSMGSSNPSMDSFHSSLSSFQSDSLDHDQTNSIQTLSTKVANTVSIPILEFGQEISSILTLIKDTNGDTNPSILNDLELVFYDYMTKIREYYFMTFYNFQQVALSEGLLLDKLMLSEEKENCLRDCEKAMTAALPRF